MLVDFLYASTVFLAFAWIPSVFAFSTFSKPAIEPVVSFSSSFHRATELFAEAGGPKYQTQNGVLQRSECVGKGSYLLYIDIEDEETVCEYEPGHVLALEIQPPTTETATKDVIDDSPLSLRLKTMTEKTRNDMEANDGWMRGPYTVSRGYGSNANGNEKHKGFQVLIKEVGFKSNVLATSPKGTPVRFGGKFKVPIVEGILDARFESNTQSDELSNTKPTRRVVLIASGVGVGPCIGACEKLLSITDSEIASIDLLASFRTRTEICMEPDLTALREDQESKTRFDWKYIITTENGRLTQNGPEKLAEEYLRPTGGENVSAIRNTHYHIIGNGQLVKEWTAGLELAGIPTSRITSESYFNHMGEANTIAIETISEAILLIERDAMTYTSEGATKPALSKENR